MIKLKTYFYWNYKKTKMKNYFYLSIILFLSSLSFAQTDSITLEDLLIKGKYKTQSIGSVIHLNDGEHYVMRDSTKNIVEYEYATGNPSKILLNIGDFTEVSNLDSNAIEDISFSPDEKYLLLGTESVTIFRYSASYKYLIWDIENKTMKPLSNKGLQRLATFSPKGNQIAFVRDNNIFVKDLVSDKEIQIAKDGVVNKIINGSPDWVYEEEFGFTKAFDWSSDGSKIAFMKFDESKVKEYEFPIYGETYPESFKYKYPKPGEENSVVSVWIYDLNKKNTVKVDVGKETDQYIPRIKWTKDANLLSVIRLNRLQNKAEVLIANSETGNSKVILTDENKYYINKTLDLTFLKDNKFICESEADGFKHLYLYDIKGKLINQITKGEWEISLLNGVDEENGLIYYISDEPSPMERGLYSIKIDGTEKKKLSEKSGYYYADYSKTFKYAFIYYNNANSPGEIWIQKTSGEMISVLKENTKLKNLIEEKSFVKKEFFKFKTSDDVELNGWMMKPNTLEKGKKYPLLMYVYGGPGSQQVLDAYIRNDYIWYQMLVKEGYIVACVDNRGTGGRGEVFGKCMYMHIGTKDVCDQIEAAKYLGSLDYVDKDRIGIWGWSGGGYFTLMCLTKGADVFKTGIAVAPVTDWKYYDDIYTERFMRTPKENQVGYEESSVLNYVDSLKGKLLIVHGSADDNVHFQNTMEFINAMITANKYYEMLVYPNRNHFILGPNTRYHLYKNLTEFIYKNL
jgi:dipeptidyl-peptidase 4